MKFIILSLVLCGFLLAGCRSDTYLERFTKTTCDRIEGQTLLFSTAYLQEMVYQATRIGYTPEEFVGAVIGRCPKTVVDYSDAMKTFRWKYRRR